MNIFFWKTSLLTLLITLSFQSTTISRRPGFAHICHVTGFVTYSLDVLEERRLVIVRNKVDNDKESENRPLFRGGKEVPK